MHGSFMAAIQDFPSNMIADEKKNIPQGCPQGVQNHIIHIKASQLSDKLYGFHAKAQCKTGKSNKKESPCISANDGKDQAKRNKTYYISEQIRYHCQYSKLFSVHPKSFDLLQGSQVIMILSLGKFHAAEPLRKKQEIDKRKYINQKQYCSRRFNFPFCFIFQCSKLLLHSLSYV